MNELISIIVPVYNIESYISKCIESIMKQTYDDIEIILVDDGSKDNSAAICDEYADKDSRIKVIHKDNGGLSSARNAGIDAARGTYIGFVDGDDYLDDDMYQALYDGIKSSGAAVSCCGLYKEGLHFSKKIGVSDNPRLYAKEEAVKEILLNGAINVSVCCKLFNRSVFEKLRFPIGKVNEDEAIVINTIDAGNVFHVGDAKYHYSFREDSITNQYGLSGAKTMYFNMRNVAKSVRSKYPSLGKVCDIYEAKRSFDVLMIYNSSKLHKDELYYQARKKYNKLWLSLLKSGKGVKDRCFFILERLGLLKLLFMVLK